MVKVNISGFVQMLTPRHLFAGIVYMDENAKSLRRTFREPTLAQIKKTAGRVFKKTVDSKLVADEKTLTELRTYAYKSKLAAELKGKNKKTSSD